MAITRSGSVHNMDSQEPLVMLPPNKRFTRGQAHRLLKINNIPHNHSAPLVELLYLINYHNLSVSITIPGSLEPEKKEPEHVKAKKPKLTVIKSSFGDLPNNVPKLRRICKDRKIPFKREDSKMTLINRIMEHKETA